MPIYTIKELKNIKSLAEESFPFEIVVITLFAVRHTA